MRRWLSGLLPAVPFAYAAARRARRTYAYFNTRRYPSFVYDGSAGEPLGIPVFTYHSIADASTPDSLPLAEFEQHLRYLAENGYHTITADELHAHLVHDEPVPPRAVMLTFDDGRATVWTAAFPLLQKYGHKAVVFLVPGTMRDGPPRPTLADHWDSRPGADLAAITDADLSAQPVMTWDEARVMQASGLVDFQSHTLDHTLIYTGPQLVDFVHPGIKTGYANYAFPARMQAGADHLHCRPPSGTPIYRSQPRMGSARRFYDDEGLRAACQQRVADAGGDAFFTRPDWRAELERVVRDYRANHTLDEHYETTQQQSDAICHSLAQSKALIEGQLGSTVRHLCYPWHRYSILAASLAREVGYETAFIAANPQKLAPDWNNPYVAQRALPRNEYGDDPYQITRIDARDGMVLSLPGRQRLTYAQRVRAMLLERPQALARWL